ncbi:hypothetical protein [Shimia ponticola]|uniref:hypothetical protein n=1 Tax=Shimia ponticola TaxID=2582893 RepID=UPI0011BE3A2E|nr:hypothetical protein [Shimia ponticola]
MKVFNTVAAILAASVLSGCETGGAITTPPGPDTELTCDASAQACATRHAIKADACLRLAQDEVRAGRASGAEAVRRASCARQNFSTALGTLPDAQGSVGAGNLAALRVTRQTATTTSAGRAANDALDQAATAYLAKHPGLNAGAYYQGDAALYQALRATSRDCGRLTMASQLAMAAEARQNPPRVPSLASAIATLQTQASQAAAQAGCVS